MGNQLAIYIDERAVFVNKVGKIANDNTLHWFCLIWLSIKINAIVCIDWQSLPQKMTDPSIDLCYNYRLYYHYQ